ncbi:MAG: hypothetical protein ACK4UW_14270 [Rhizobium rhizophilum]|uniref:hypothetical protein n=1 Tax=Rhizobium rhizophilum TaxID=1850373 RepID=UPI00391B78DB
MRLFTNLAAAMMGIVALAGISTANAQTGPVRSAKPGIQLVQKKEAGRRMLDGHPGMKERRKGYRRHSDGYWYPPAAFAVEGRGKKQSRDDRRLPQPDRR